MLQTDLIQQRVTIVGQGLLLDDGVEHLLKLHRPNLIVSHVIYSSKLTFLIYAVPQPDVILIVESSDMDTVHILDLLSSWPFVTKLRIIVIRLRNNIIDVYEEVKLVAGRISCDLRKITARNADDLLSAFVN
jgi:hypothetical protein